MTLFASDNQNRPAYTAAAMFIPLFKPSLGEAEIQALRPVFASGWIGLGPKTREFEEAFARYLGVRYAVGLNSATAALHLAVAAQGIGPGDEVLLPSLTFVSTPHAVCYAGATPVFVDIDERTLNMDPTDLEKKITARSRAVIPVHYGGDPCDMEAIGSIARRKDLAVIEDAAHALGSELPPDGKKAGSAGDVGCFSFHAVKNLATGDGGMLATDSEEIFRRAKSLRWMGIDKDTWERTAAAEEGARAGIRRYAQYHWYYEVHELGFKCHMNDIAAAIGIVQLEKLEAANARRREIRARYDRELAEIPGFETPAPPLAKSSCHNYVVKLDSRDELNVFLREKGISSGVHYLPAHLQPYYRERFPSQLPVTERVWKRLLTLPMFPDLAEEDLSRVISSVKSFLAS
jgi:perosamine synthetase